MAVNENVYGRREDWIDVGSPQNWSGDNTFLNDFYPKFKTGCPQGQTDGRLSNLLDAGTITRDTTIDSSPAWVYTSLKPQPIGFQWAAASEVTYNNVYEEGTWIGDTYHYNLTPIMFQVYRYTGRNDNSTFTGFDGWYAPETELAKKVKNIQATERFSPNVFVSAEEMEDAVIVADDTERFALTAEEAGLGQTVFVQSTSIMYCVIDETKLSSDNGYQYMWNSKDFTGSNSSPIVSFCPKNFVLSLYITYGTVVENGGSLPQEYRRIVTRPNDLFTSETIPLANFTEELIQQRLDDIESFLANYRESQGTEYPHHIYLVVFGMHCKVYSRDSGDTFIYQYSGDSSNTPIFNALYNGGVRLTSMQTYEAPIIRYVYNQNYAGRWTYSILPLLGDIGGGQSSSINIAPNYSRTSYWNNYEYTWWRSNGSELPVVLGVDFNNSFYQRLGDIWEGYAYRFVPVVATINTADDVQSIVELGHSTAAQYGLFFCDDYSNLSTKDTPKMWLDPDMMCGTYTENGGIRITLGDYTRGHDNISQPQFFMVDSEGNMWDSAKTFHTNNNYPQMTSWNLLEFDTPPLPVNDIATTANGNYPMLPYWNIVPIPQKPYPYPVFVTEDNYPDMPEWDLPLIGACASAKELQIVSIANSVKSIGYNSFRKTQLTKATLADDCTYYSVSFPDGCRVTGGEIINNQN